VARSLLEAGQRSAHGVNTSPSTALTLDTAGRELASRPGAFG
jgi:hypothetical protein